MTLLDDVVALLDERGVAHALIGAAALAAHGVSRSTFDQDLLAVDPRVLDAAFWTTLARASVEVRRGDADDPLAGVVRACRDGDRDVDVVVGRHRWQQDVIARAGAAPGASVRIAEAPDVILLKLFAGGSQDRWDIHQLLTLDSSGEIAAAVDARVEALPTGSRALWLSLRPSS